MGLFKSLLNAAIKKTATDMVMAAKERESAKKACTDEARAKAELAARMRAEAKEYSAGYLKIVKESATLVNETTNPEVFFKRYDLMLEHLERLAGLECTGIFENSRELPSAAFLRIEAQFPAATNDFIDRAFEEAQKHADSLKTEKGKTAALHRFFDSMDKYIIHMDSESVEYLNRLREKHK